MKEQALASGRKSKDLIRAPNGRGTRSNCKQSDCSVATSILGFSKVDRHRIFQDCQRASVSSLCGQHCRASYLWSDVAAPPAPGVKEEGKVGGVVGRQVCRFERCKVREVDPAPAGDQNVLALDVAMADASVVALCELQC